MAIQPMETYCSKYSYVKREGSSIDLSGLASPHYHVGYFHMWDISSVVCIEAVLNGQWAVRKALGTTSIPRASILFIEMKKMMRQEARRYRREGLVVLEDACSPIRIIRTFDHIQDNQRLGLYMPERDGELRL